MQQQMQQRQQYTGMGIGMGMSAGIGLGMGSNGFVAGVGPAPGPRLRTEQLVGSLQQLLLDFETRDERGEAEELRGLRAAAVRQQDRNEALQGRNDVLQARADQLAAEKAALLEKQMDLFLAGSASSSKLLQLSQDIDVCSVQRTAAEKEAAGLREALAVQAQEKRRAQEADRDMQSASVAREDAEARALASQQHVAALQVEVGGLKQLGQQAASEVQQVQQQLEAAHAEICQLRESLEAERTAGAVTDLDAPVLHLKEAEQRAHTVEVAAAEQRMVLEDALSRTAESVMQEQARSAELEQRLGVALTEAAAKTGLEARIAELEAHLRDKSSGALNTAALKAVMQDIYTRAGQVFEAEGDGNEARYSPAEVVKRLKHVLKQVTNEHAI
mmetsp:Transcript_663/g.1432  ORF Transcript_663/g.1432 Transcript_663/m.1432 type:complete len:388 (+) Transcript_663:3-1166(+)